MASADITIGELNVPAEGVNLDVGSNSSDNSGAKKSTSAGSKKSSSSSGGSSSGGSSSGGVSTLQAPQQAPQQGGVASGNSVNLPLNVSADVCGNGIAVLGSSSASCGEGPVPPQPPEPEPPETPPTPVPPPEEEEPPTQPRPVPPPGAADEAGAAEELPVTGINAGSLAALAGALLAAGAACLGATSRRFRMGRR